MAAQANSVVRKSCCWNLNSDFSILFPFLWKYFSLTIQPLPLLPFLLKKKVPLPHFIKIIIIIKGTFKGQAYAVVEWKQAVLQKKHPMINSNRSSVKQRQIWMLRTAANWKNTETNQILRNSEIKYSKEFLEILIYLLQKWYTTLVLWSLTETRISRKSLLKICTIVFVYK